MFAMSIINEFEEYTAFSVERYWQLIQQPSCFPIPMLMAADWLGYKGKRGANRSFYSKGFVLRVDYTIRRNVTGSKVFLTEDCFRDWVEKSKKLEAKQLKVILDEMFCDEVCYSIPIISGIKE